MDIHYCLCTQNLTIILSVVLFLITLSYTNVSHLQQLMWKSPQYFEQYGRLYIHTGKVYTLQFIMEIVVVVLWSDCSISQLIFFLLMFKLLIQSC